MATTPSEYHGLTNTCSYSPAAGSKRRTYQYVLPPKLALVFSRSEPYGLFVVLGLLVTGLLGQLLWPAVEGLQTLAAALVGL